MPRLDRGTYQPVDELGFGCFAPAAEARRRRDERRAELMVGWAELPRSPGHASYDRPQAVLVGAGFDRHAGKERAACYASRRGRPSLPPGRYFRTHLVGYSEGIGSERGLEWRCADSLSLREFLRLGTTEPVPDPSWLSETRSRLPLEVRQAVLARVLQRLAGHGLIKGDRIGIGASTTEANAALRAIVRRDSGEGYREMLERLAAEGGIASPAAEDLVRPDREREGERLPDAERASATDPEAGIAKLEGGRTRLAHEPEHAVDPDAGATVAAEVHAADQGDAATLPGTLEAAEADPAAVDAGPTAEAPAGSVADEGCRSREGLEDLEGGARRSRIAEKGVAGVDRRRGDEEARRRSTTIGRGCARAWPRGRPGSGPGRSSVASRRSSPAAACAAPGCGAAGTRRSATSCTSPATIPGW